MQKGMGFMCCGPWMHHGRTGVRLTIGFLLILIGSIWYATRMGWIEVRWFYTVHVFPLVVIIIGVYLVYRGLNARRRIKSENDKEV